jgi:hypothetical protein
MGGIKLGAIKMGVARRGVREIDCGGASGNALLIRLDPVLPAESSFTERLGFTASDSTWI